jgi:hypothetical protein
LNQKNAKKWDVKFDYFNKKNQLEEESAPDFSDKLAMGLQF